MSAVADCYQKLLAAGELAPDEDQRAAVAVLDALASELSAKPKLGLFSKLRGKAVSKPRCIYMWGVVGLVK